MCVCVCVCVGVGGCASACQCVCLLYPSIFFPLDFVLVNDISLVSHCCFCFGNVYNFVFVFVAVCFFLLYALVFYVYCHVITPLTDVLSLMFFHVPPLGFLK